MDAQAEQGNISILRQQQVNGVLKLKQLKAPKVLESEW